MSQDGPPALPGDPSMEDILASIRRILQDDSNAAENQPAENQPAGDQLGEDHPGGRHASPPPSNDDVFQLDHSMIVQDPAPHPTHPEPADPELADPELADPELADPEPVSHEGGQTPLATQHEHPAEPDFPPHHPPAEEETLLAPETAAAATASMGALVRVLGQRHTQVYRGGPTLEDIVRDEIRPLVKNWLDENLAPLVERMVRAEIERVITRSI